MSFDWFYPSCLLDLMYFVASAIMNDIHDFVFFFFYKKNLLSTTIFFTAAGMKNRKTTSHKAMFIRTN